MRAVRLALWGVIGAVGLWGCASDLAAPPTAGVRMASAPLDMSSGRPKALADLGGGRTGAFVIDTGSQSAVLTKATADALKLEVIGEVLLGSPAGGAPIPSFIVSMGALSIAGAPASRTEAVVAADETLPATVGMGVLPPTLWADQIVTLNFAANTIGFSDPAGAPALDWRPLDARNLTSAEIEIAGERILAHVDSGNPRGVVLPMRFAKLLGVEDKLVPAPSLRTVDAAVRAFTAPVDVSVRLGTVTIPLSQAVFAESASANVGSGALKGLSVVIDNPNRRWALVAAN